MTKLILIRHGETNYNAQNRYCGFNDPPLNNRGVWQSRKLAAELEGLSIDKVYSSDLQRSYESAKIIFKGRPIEKVRDFREMNFGIFEGMKYGEIIKKHPKLYRDWIDNSAKVKIPKGEALKDLAKRVRQGITTILSRHKDRKMALVTHGGPIRVILCDALKFNLDMFWQIEQDIGALNIIDYPESSSPIIVKMNDTSHLDVEEAAIV